MTEPTLPDNPITLFKSIFSEAVKSSNGDPTAMVLATCTKDAKPSARVVLLKDVDSRGFTFFTNYFSRKSRDLGENPYASLCFYWPEIEQQVRIEGLVEKVSPSVSDEYFAGRPRESQLGAWASDQSQPLRSREHLLNRMAEFKQQYEETTVPRPAYWGGFLLVPDTIEFWKNGEFRLHDRFLYTRVAGSTDWVHQRLNP